MKPANYIGHDHPSFGTKQAWYLFAMQFKGAVTKLLLVNAKNAWAVQCVERILGEDQKASPTCHCVMVFRECNIGLRSDLGEEIDLIEFVRDIADPERFQNDSLTLQSLENALRAENGTEKTQGEIVAISTHRRVQVQEKASPAPEKTQEDGALRAKVEGILAGLGYKKTQINVALNDVDMSGTHNEIVHEALQQLAS